MIDELELFDVDDLEDCEEIIKMISLAEDCKTLYGVLDLRWIDKEILDLAVQIGALKEPKIELFFSYMDLEGKIDLYHGYDGEGYITYEDHGYISEYDADRLFVKKTYILG